MATVKRIVCLANSRKLNGRCLAGKEFSGKEVGAWIRPVGAREHGEVSEYERQYEDGSDPRVLDVIDVPVLDPQPKDFQRENWLLDPEYYWAKVGRATWSDLKRLADRPEPLWIDGTHTYNGFNDKIPLGLVGDIRTSLRLLHVSTLAISVFRPGKPSGISSAEFRGDSNTVAGSIDYGLQIRFMNANSCRSPTVITGSERAS
jgi:Dual OB-containing domain